MSFCYLRSSARKSARGDKNSSCVLLYLYLRLCVLYFSLEDGQKWPWDIPSKNKGDRHGTVYHSIFDVDSSTLATQVGISRHSEQQLWSSAQSYKPAALIRTTPSVCFECSAARLPGDGGANSVLATPPKARTISAIHLQTEQPFYSWTCRDSRAAKGWCLPTWGFGSAL